MFNLVPRSSATALRHFYQPTRSQLRNLFYKDMGDLCQINFLGDTFAENVAGKCQRTNWEIEGMGNI